jgi:hypothetical protein
VTDKIPNNLQASFSMLLMSIASSAAMAMGLSPDPENGKMEKDKNLARFNIDLLIVLKDKTKNNLNSDEEKFLEAILSDLQLKFVSMKE